MGRPPPPSAAKNVQLYVSRLRKALAAAGSDSEARITTRGRGYELQLPDDAVDAARFERLVERARREAERGVAVDGAAHRALRLWRGAPLADVAEEPFAGPEIRRLEELHLRAIELDIDAELAAGRHAEVLARLEALVAEHPLRERFHAQRMLALYRAARQSEAMDAYREAHRTLVAEIGAKPGPELRKLQDAILRQDPALDARPPPPELPRQLEGGSPLIAGRDRELRWLRKRWREAEAARFGIALVSGPSGIGKTRLAAELAAQAQREGTEVLYAAGSGSPEAALAAIRAAAESELPTLLVLDDADDASPAVLEAAAELDAKPRDATLLLLVLHRDEHGPPAFADAAQRLLLRPLRVEAAADIAGLYVPADGVPMPPTTLMAESEGVPLRVHRAASGWAQALAAEDLESAAGQAAVDQVGLRAVRAKVAGGVASLQLVRERTSLYVVPEPPDPSEPEVCPFRGLAPFDSAHAEYFFGRARLVADLVARLVGSTVIAVVGPSGSGKSSVIRAGLLPSLAAGVLPGSERWRQVVMRPGERPVAELRRALARAAGTSAEVGADDGDALAGALHSLGADERLVLAVDQLEEIFTSCRDEGERTAFCGALAAIAADPDQRVVVVLGIRADFYGRCAEYPELSDWMSANNVLVGPMRRDELRRAIELPAKRAGLRVEPSLVSALVGDVAEEPGGLPLLSTTLVELWQERSGRTLRRASYEASGGVNGAVARLAERAYQRLTPVQRERARAILLRLTDAEQPAPVRRRVPLSELDVEQDEDAASALAVLTESRLVTVDEGAVEVAHEALLREWPRLRGWLEEDVEGRRLHQHLIGAAAEWDKAGRDPAELYRGARLTAALDWAAGHDQQLNELERQFLDESQAASEREAERQRRTNRRLRTLLAGVGVLLAAAVVAGVIAISQRQEARSAAIAEAEARFKAENRRLVAESANVLPKDRHLALLLAAEAHRRDPSVESLSALQRALTGTLGFLGYFGHGRGYEDAVFSSDGKRLVAVSENGIEAYRMADSRLLHRIELAKPPGATALSVGGDLAAISRGGLIRLYDVPSETQRLEPLEHGAKVTALAFSPRLDRLASGGADGTVVLWHLKSGTSRTLEAHANGIRELAFSPDGSVLAAAPSATPGTPADAVGVRLWDAGTGARVGRNIVPPRAPGQPSGATAIEFGPSGTLLVSGPLAVRRWDLDHGKALGDVRHPGLSKQIDPTSEKAILDLELVTRSTAAVSTGARVTLLNLATGQKAGKEFDSQLRNELNDPAVRNLAVSPDGSTLAVWGDDGLSVWSLDGRQLLARALPRGDAGFAMGNSDGTRLIASPTFGGPPIAWDMTADTPRRLPFIDQPALAGYLDHGRVLVTNPTQGETTGVQPFRVWDPVALTHVSSLPPSEFAYGLEANRNIGLLAIGQAPVVKVFELDSGRLVAELDDLARFRGGNVASSVSFSPDGKRLVGTTDGGHAVVWDTSTWKPLGEPLSAEKGAVTFAIYSPDRRYLMTSDQAGTITLRDPESFEPIGSRLVGHTGTVVTAAAFFSPDGKRLVTTGPDGPRLWDLESRTEIGNPFPADPESLSGGGGEPTGRFIITMLGEHMLLWNIDTDSWAQIACRAAGGNMTRVEWNEFGPADAEYRATCDK